MHAVTIIVQHARSIKLCTAQPLVTNMLGRKTMHGAPMQLTTHRTCHYWPTCLEYKTMRGATIVGHHAMLGA